MFAPFALAAACTAAVAPLPIAAHRSPNVPAKLVSAVLEEAFVLWRQLGVTIVAALDGERMLPRVTDGCTSFPERPVVRVSFDDGPGSLTEFATTLGSIEFDGPTTPRADIHLFYSNAYDLLVAAYGKPAVENMPPAGQRIFLSRALGRALAHEIGHYVLGSKAHAERGLMKKKLSTVELFGPRRNELTLSDADRATVASRLVEPGRLASRERRGNMPVRGQ